MWKVFIGIFAALSISLSSCEAKTAPSAEEADNSQVVPSEELGNEALSQNESYASITPLQIEKKVSQLSPYIMVNYGFQKLVGAEHFQVSLFAAHTEDMIYEDEKPIVAIMFVSRGDLQETPLAFYIAGELNPEFNDRLNFCVLDGDDEDRLIIYAIDSCHAGKAPYIGSITVQLNLSDNSVIIDGKKKYQLN